MTPREQARVRPREGVGHGVIGWATVAEVVWLPTTAEECRPGKILGHSVPPEFVANITLGYSFKEHVLPSLPRCRPS